MFEIVIVAWIVIMILSAIVRGAKRREIKNDQLDREYEALQRRRREGKK
jgi:hypothetical protein